MHIYMDFIAGGLVADRSPGSPRAAVLFGYAWWAPLVLGGRVARHPLAAARERGLARPQHRARCARRSAHADYAYRLAVDPPAAKELRLFGLADWVMERFVGQRTLLHELQYEATRLRERPLVWSLLLVLAANVVVFWSLAVGRGDGPPRPRAAWSCSRRPRWA